MKAFLIHPDNMEIRELEIPDNATIKDLCRIIGTNYTRFVLFGKDNDVIMLQDHAPPRKPKNGFRFLNAYMIKNAALVVGTFGTATYDIKEPTISLNDLKRKVEFCTAEEVPCPRSNH